MKNKAQVPPDLAQSEALPKFSEIKAHVFREGKGTLFLGSEEITPALRSVLRDEAEYIKNSRLWEILNASVIDEAYNLALIQSKDFDHVEFAKAMKHWSVFMNTVIQKLANK